VILDGAVLVVRLPNWLGDTVMALPALAALRAARPDALVTVIGPWAPLLTGQAVADVFLRYPGDGRKRRRLNAAVRAMRPDAAVLLPNSFGSALAARRWGARIRLGYDTDLRRGLLTHVVALPSPRRHQIDEYSGLLEAAGIPPRPGIPEWHLGDDREAESTVTALLADAGCAGAGPLVGLHLGEVGVVREVGDEAARQSVLHIETGIGVGIVRERLVRGLIRRQGREPIGLELESPVGAGDLYTNERCGFAEAVDAARAQRCGNGCQKGPLVFPGDIAPQVEAPHLRTGPLETERLEGNRDLERPALIVHRGLGVPDGIPVGVVALPFVTHRLVA